MTRGLILALAGVLATASGVLATAPADPARHAFDRARWSAARADTLVAVELLSQVRPTDGPATRAVLLRLSLDDASSPAVTGSDRERTWSTLLRWTRDLEATDDASPLARLVRAAVALDAGNLRAAREHFDDLDAPKSLRALTLHLRALAAADVSRADALRRQLAEMESELPLDRRLIDAAALRTGALALSRGEDPAPWFDRIDPASPVAAWSDWTTALHDGSEEDLAAWITRHSDHPAVIEARLRRAGLALEAGDHARARALHLTLESDLEAHASELAAIAANDTLLLDWSQGLWTDLEESVPHLDDAAWSDRVGSLRDGVLLERDLPRASSLPFEPPTAFGPSRVAPDERTRDRQLQTELADAIRDFDTTRRALAAAEAEARARGDYRARGLARLEAFERARRTSHARLDSLDRKTPALLGALRAVEDSLLARIARRTTTLSNRLEDHEVRARDLARWYGRGPMARRDPAVHPEVPVPARHLDTEEEFARALRTTLVDFSTQTPDLVRRSFSEVFARRLDDGAADLRAVSDSLGRRAADVDGALVAWRETVDPKLIAARDAFAAATAHRAAATRRASDHRLDVARGVLTTERSELEDRREAVAYGTAVVTTRLALAGDPNLLDEARSRWSAFVDAGCDPRVRGDARYRWADLELVAAREDFQDRMGAWLDGDGRGERAMAPLMDIDPALALFRDILRDDPDFARRDLVLLHLGMLHADRGDPEAGAYLTTLVSEHPDSPVVPEAQLRRGELAFAAEDYAGALAPLRAAARATDPEIRAVALYKLGWSAHATGRDLEAIDTFDALLDSYAADDAPTSFDLADEARALYLRAVARAGGAPAFAASIERNGERDDAPALLADLSALLSSYALDTQAGAADRLFLDRYVTHPRALDAARRWIDNEARRGGVEAADAALLAVVDDFVPSGRWALAQVDSLRAAGDSFAREALLGVAVRRHESARAKPSVRAWNTTRELYVRLADTWPQDQDVRHWHLLAGECALANEDHATAFEHFAVAATDSGEVGEQAAWQTVATSDAWYRTSIPNDATVGSDSLAQRFLTQADAYRARRPHAEGNADLEWRSLRIALAHGWDDDVLARSTGFVIAHPNDARSVDASRLYAEALYRQEDHLAAAQAFEGAAARARTAGRDSLATELDEWVPHSFELHVTAVEAVSKERAAPLWREVAERWPDGSSAESALYRSGLGYASVASDSLAIDAWTTLIERHPRSEFAPDAYRKIAATREENDDDQGAADALVAFADAHPEAGDAADALLHAVDLRERSGDLDGRDELLDTYLTRHPDDLQTLQAVRESRARAAIEAGAEGAAVTAYLDFAAAHPDRADDGLLAHHAFQRADTRWDGYVELTLDQPLEPSLVRKRDALTALIDDYREVAERGVSPWAQAATTRIGEALLLMGDALVDSERPAGLTGDDRLAYDEVIEEQAWTFHDRGEGALREFLRHHERGQDETLDDWAARARQLLFPRIAQRFLHKPSFDYPVLESDEIARLEGASPETAMTGAPVLHEGSR